MGEDKGGIGASKAERVAHCMPKGSWASAERNKVKCVGEGAVEVGSGRDGLLRKSKRTNGRLDSTCSPQEVSQIAL